MKISGEKASPFIKFGQFPLTTCTGKTNTLLLYLTLTNVIPRIWMGSSVYDFNLMSDCFKGVVEPIIE